MAGFVSGQSVTYNIHKVLAALKYTKSHPLEELAIILIIIILDAEKAFDNVNLN